MMIEVFITDITKRYHVIEVVKAINKIYSELKINFDIDETGLPFPHGYTVLRVEGENIDVEKLKLMVNTFGFTCKIMEDKTNE